MITTSINIKPDVYAVLSRAAIKLSTSRRDVIIRLLMLIMHDIEHHQGGFTSVSYQPDRPEGGWHCFSIKLNPDENEFLHDLRKICKCSVSLLVAIAVIKYLDEMLINQLRGVYNKAPFSNYILHRIIEGGVICWKIYWGIPKNHGAPLLE